MAPGPSSDLASLGHLLPKGEKRGFEPSPRSLFSPEGRRPEGPDEGSVAEARHA
jgi:hypothetical protein